MEKIVRYILIIFFIASFITYLSTNWLTSCISLLISISLIPNVYKKFKQENNKKLQTLLPIFLFVILCLTLPKVSEENNKIESNDNQINTINSVEEVVEEVKESKVLPESLEFLYKTAEIDINETKDFILNVMPKEAQFEDVEIVSSDENIIKVEKNVGQIEKGKVSFKVIPIAEGEATVLAKFGDIKTPDNILVNVVDNNRIEEEKKQQEEKERLEEQKKTTVQTTNVTKENKQTTSGSVTQSNTKTTSSSENNKKTTSNNSGKQNSTTSNSNSYTSSSTVTSTTNYNGQTVYVTPKGKCYHYLSTCGGKNSKATDLDSAKASGYAPCQKCVH